MAIKKKVYELTINNGGHVSTLRVYSHHTLKYLVKSVRTGSWIGAAVLPDSSQNVALPTKTITGILEVS